MSEVMQAMKDLQAGKKTLDEVVEFFKNRTWPPLDPPVKKTVQAMYEDMYNNDLPDVEPDGGYGEIATARFLKIITPEQKVALIDAAQEAINGKAK